MRIALKLMAVLIGLLLCVLAAETWLRTQREAALFEADLRRDQHVLGRALQAAFELVYRERGADDARELLDVAESAEVEIAIRLVSLDPDAAPALRPVLTPEALAPALAGREIVHVAHSPDPGKLYTYIPLDLDDPRLSAGELALELSRSLADQRAYLDKGLRRFLALTGMMTVIAALVAVFLGDRLVGRAVRVLTQHARRVGKGEFIRHEPVRQRDELGQLAVELDAMADNLREVRRQRDAELEARAKVEAQLRHADRLATVGTLAAGLAHELGTPLHVIAARARMLVDRGARDDDARRNAETISNQCARMNRVVRQLLDFARPTRGDRADLELPALIASAIELIAGTTPSKIRVELAPTSDGCVVHGDRDQLEQVFTNLLVNAVQAMPEGGVVRVSWTLHDAPDDAPQSVRVDGRRFVRIRFADEGVGIRPEDLPRLFDPFFTTKDVGEGTGLGLAIAHGIVVDHGGWIAAISEPGAGARFDVWLPAGGET